MFASLLSDVRLAFRTLRQRPGFALVAVLTLALGIGSTTAIYSVVNGVLLAPLPYADRLVEVRHRNEQMPQMDGRFSPQDFADLESAGVYQRIAAWWYAAGQSGANALLPDGARRLAIAYADGAFFETMGTPALRGWPFGELDAAAQARVVVISERLWRSAFGADADVIGRTVRIDAEPFTIAAIMPSTFQYPAPDVDAWLPLTLMGEDDVPHIRGLRWQGAIARLAPGVPVRAAARETNALVERLALEYPESNEGWTRADVVPLRTAITGEVRPALLVLLAAVAAVLLIGCANVANLLLVHGTRRAREVAVRTALGAGRPRIIRQLLTEHMVLALIGGVVGVLFAFVAVDALLALAGERLPRADAVAVNVRVLAVALVLSLVTGLLAGCLPAWRVAATDIQRTLREGGRTGSEGPGRARIRSGLVVGETAVAVVLVIAAGLMIRSFVRLTSVDPGFSPERVVSFGVTMQSELFGGTPEEATARRDAYRRRMFEMLRELPGVVAVGGAKTMPLAAGGEPYAFASTSGAEADLQPEGGVMIVTPDYFRALGVPLLAGREFTDRDAPPDEPVLIVNQSFVDRYWSGDDAVGRIVYMDDVPVAIVGVVPDIRHDGVASAPRPTAYIPGTYAPRSSQKVFVRTSAEAATAMHAIREALRRFDPGLPISDLSAMTQVVSSTVAQPRMLTTLLGLFGGFALLLAALGMYGVIAYGVTQRTQEIGIRMALGARPARVLRMVVGEALGLAVAGIGLGLMGALVLTRVLRAALFEVSTTDPFTFVVVPLTLLIVAAAAALLPAWRATRIHPGKALGGS